MSGVQLRGMMHRHARQDYHIIDFFPVVRLIVMTPWPSTTASAGPIETENFYSVIQRGSAGNCGRYSTTVLMPAVCAK